MIPYNPFYHPAIWYGHHRTAQHERKGGTSKKMRKTPKTSKISQVSGYQLFVDFFHIFFQFCSNTLGTTWKHPGATPEHSKPTLGGLRRPKQAKTGQNRPKLQNQWEKRFLSLKADSKTL